MIDVNGTLRCKAYRRRAGMLARQQPLFQI
jgi:hypothetical protein